MGVRRWTIGIGLVVGALVTGWRLAGSAGAQPGGNVDIEAILPGILDNAQGRCLAFISDGDGMVPPVTRDSGGHPTPKGDPVVTGTNPGELSLTVPGEPVAAILEWSGTDDLTPPGAGDSTLQVEVVASPDGPAAAADVIGRRSSPDGTVTIPSSVLPQALDGQDQPTGRPPAPVYTWIENLTPLFGGGAGTYQLRITGYDAALSPEGGRPASWGATVTVLYDAGGDTCEAAPLILWKIGADVYFGGDRPAEEIQWGGGVQGEGHTSDMFLFELPEPAAEDLVVPVQFSAGGSDMTAYLGDFPDGPTFDRCRTTSIWLTAGPAGTEPPAASQFVSIKLGDFDPALGAQWGRPIAKAEFGAVEILQAPFNLDACSAYRENPPPDGPGNLRSFVTGTFMGVTQEFGLRYEPGHPCPGGALTGACASLGLVAGSPDPAGGGWRGPEWALIRFEILVPAGSSWFAFQLESPTDQRVKVQVSPESGGWSGQVLAIIPAQTETGSLEVRKTISGETGGHDPGSTFTVTVDCAGTAFDQQFELAPGGAPGTITGIPVGTSCTVSEISTPPPLPGFSYREPTFTPSAVVVISAPQLFQVTVDNPLVNGQLGSLEVVKQLDPFVQDAFGLLPFGFLLDCSDDAFDQEFTVTAEESFTLTGLPVGTSCSITETSRPDTGSPDLIWGVPVYQPGQNVVITESTAAVAIQVRNPLESFFLVRKSVVDPGGLAADGISFTIEITCDDGFAATIVLQDQETWMSPFLPVGTRCIIVETIAPDPGPGARWAAASYSPAETGGNQAQMVVGVSGGTVQAATQVVEVQNIATTGIDSDVMALLGGILVTTGTGLVVVGKRPRRHWS